MTEIVDTTEHPSTTLESPDTRVAASGAGGPPSEELKGKFDVDIVFKAISDFIKDLGLVWGKTKWYIPIRKIMGTTDPENKAGIVRSVAFCFPPGGIGDLSVEFTIPIGSTGRYQIPVGKLLKTDHKDTIMAHLKIITELLEGAVVISETDAADKVFDSLKSTVESRMKGKAYKDPKDMMTSIMGDASFFSSITDSVKGITSRTSNPKKVLKSLHTKLGKILDEDD